MLFDLGPTIMAAELAAKSVYHRVLVVENEFTLWRHDNPAIAHLMDEAVDLASGVLTAHGIPVAVIEQMGAMLPKIIAASLSGIAAADATVPSGSNVPVVAQQRAWQPGPASMLVAAPVAPAPIVVAPAVPEPAPAPAPAATAPAVML